MSPQSLLCAEIEHYKSSLELELIMRQTANIIFFIILAYLPSTLHTFTHAVMPCNIPSVYFTYFICMSLVTIIFVQHSQYLVNHVRFNALPQCLPN